MKQLCPKGAGKMRPALAPVEAGTANRALTGPQSSDVDAEIHKLVLALASDRDGAVSTGMTDGMEMGYARLDLMFASKAA